MASQIRVSAEAVQVPETASKPGKKTGLSSSTAIIWQEWTQKRAQNAPTLEQVQEITKKLNSM